MGQVVDLLTKLDDPAARDWYAAAADTGGWTRDVLANQIMNRTRERFAAAPQLCCTAQKRSRAGAVPPPE